MSMVLRSKSREKKESAGNSTSNTTTSNTRTSRSTISISNLSGAAAQNSGSTMVNEPSAQSAPNAPPNAPSNAQLNAALSAQINAQLSAQPNAQPNAQLNDPQAPLSISSSTSSLALNSLLNNEVTTPKSTRPNAQNNSHQSIASSDGSEDDDNDKTYTNQTPWDEFRKNLQNRQTFVTFDSPNSTQPQDITSKLGPRVSANNSNVTLAQSLANLQRGTNQQAATSNNNNNVTLAQDHSNFVSVQQQPSKPNNNVTLAQSSSNLHGFQQQPTTSHNSVTMAQAPKNLFSFQQQPTTQAQVASSNNSATLAQTLWPNLFQQQAPNQAQIQPQINASSTNPQQQALSAIAQTQQHLNTANQQQAQPAQTQQQQNVNPVQRAPPVQTQTHLNVNLVSQQQAQTNQLQSQPSAKVATQPIIQSQHVQQQTKTVLRPQQPTQQLPTATPPVASPQQHDTSTAQLLQLVLQQLQQNAPPQQLQQPFLQTPPNANLFSQAYLPLQPNQQQYMQTPQHQLPAQTQQDSPSMMQVLNNILHSLNRNNELIMTTLNSQSTPSFFFPAANSTAAANAQQQPQINTVPHQPMLSSTQITTPTPTTIVITNPNLPAIAPFDGLTDVFDFFDKMDSIVKNLNYDDAQAANFIPTNLTGDASKSLRICTNKQSYAAIKKHLIKDYSKTLDQYWNEFLNIKPKADERTKSFCINIQRILEIAKPKMASEEKEALLKNKLSKFLRSDLKSLFAMHDFKFPWADMVEMSSKVMERFNSTEIVKTKNCLVSSEYNDIDESNDIEDSSEQTVVSRKCIVCNLSNHSTESCFKLQNAISSGFFGQGSNAARANNNYRKQQQSNQSKTQNKPVSNSNQSASSSQKANSTASNNDVKAKVCQIMSISKATNLHYMNVTFTLAEHQTKLKTLIDSGATNSFINLNRLPANIQNEIKDFMRPRQTHSLD